MAIIQKIRDRYAKLAGGLIALALIAFIITSASESNIGRSIKDLLGLEPSYVIKVNGEKIEQQEYAARVGNYDVLYEVYGQGNAIDDATRAQLHDQALREMIYERLATDQMDRLGLMSTKEEENDIIKGSNPDQLVKRFPYFMDPKTQQFDPNALMAFEQKKLDMSNPEAPRALEKWEVVKDYVKRNYRIQKFSNMIINGVYYPKYLIDRDIKDQNTLASMRFVKIPFTMIDDNDPNVQVTDEDINKYIKEHPAQYTITDPTRSIEYISFENIPSTDDTAHVLDALTQIKADFAAARNAENFVGRYSDDPYIGGYVTKKTFMSPMSDSILSQPAGSVVGPYMENGAYKLTKVEEIRMLPDSVKCRHILIKTQDQRRDVLSDTVAKNRIDSIKNAVQAGADFAAMAKQFSNDDGSKDNGGEYDFDLQQRSQLSKEFADFIFDGKTGDKKVVKVENDNYSGYHYIEILSQKGIGPAYKLATVTKSLTVSSETDQLMYGKASEFAGKNTTAAAFDEAAKKAGYNKRSANNIKVNDFTIDGIGASREIIRWMYKAKAGEVSPVFKLDNRYVVAKITNIQDKGLIKPDANSRPQIESVVKAEKKTKLIKEKYKGQNSIDAIAQASGQVVMGADSFNASNPAIPNVGMAPKVTGYAFYKGFDLNTVSPPISSGDGVYFISVINRWTRPADDQDNMAMTQQKSSMEMQSRNAVSSAIIDNLKKNADIRYNSELIY